MPKIVITDKKGLVQKGGSGIDVQGGTLKISKGGTLWMSGSTLIGGLNSVEAKTAGFTAKESDAGKTFLLGGAGGTVALPASSAGWNATFVITGALGAAWLLSGSATGTNFLTGSIVGAADAAISTTIVAFHSGVGASDHVVDDGTVHMCVSMSNGCAGAQSPAVVKFEKITALKFLVNGTAQT